MTKLQKVSLSAFSAFVVVAVALSYLMGATLFEKQDKPWHMQPFVDADSLTAEYADSYKLLEKGQLLRLFADSSRTTVSVLVDAWGVPFDISLLREDFAVFNGVPHKEYLHRRLANRTKHAEFTELRLVSDSTAPQPVLYLFGGDSLEYGRNLYIDSLGYGQHMFCQKCPDKAMFDALEMMLADGKTQNVALTTQDSRFGNREKLHAVLWRVAEIARKYPHVRFIVQGTHRPTLGDPKIRRESFAHWVPAVVLN